MNTPSLVYEWLQHRAPKEPALPPPPDILATEYCPQGRFECIRQRFARLLFWSSDAFSSSEYRIGNLTCARLKGSDWFDASP